jgi:glycosyltransferase involved in cell wall biosynthesis
MITGTFPPLKCGVGDYSSILFETLSNKNDLSIYIITTEGIGYMDSANVFSIIKKWNFTSYKVLMNAINKINPDIVHIQYPTTEYKKYTFINFLPVVLKLKKYKVITTVHEFSDSSLLGQLRVLPNLIFSDAIIVVDPRFKNDATKFKLVKQDSIHYINIGSNIPMSSLAHKEKKQFKEKVLGDNNKFVIGYFGFINEKKGLETILNALVELKKTKYEIVFLVIGELNESDNYHKKLKNMIIDLELQDEVVITGYLPKEDVGNYISITDMMALPFVNGVSSRNGSFLAAIQENKSVITTNPENSRLDIEYNKVYFLEKYDEVDKFKGFVELFINADKSSDNIDVNMDNTRINWGNIGDEHYNLYKSLISD